MKTIKIIAIVFTYLISSTFKLAAQQPTCSYMAQNDFNCTAVVQVAWYDDCTGGASNLCYTNTYTLNANGPTYGINCSGCNTANLCNVVVTLVSIGGSPINVSVDNGTWFTDNVQGSFTGCSSTTYSIRWHYNSINLGL